MKIQTSAGLLNLFFEHDIFKKGENRGTICIITDQLGRTISRETAVCRIDKGDNFCFKTGRKIALTRALTAIQDKRTRKEVWSAYFEKTKGGK